jgi:hypothetical protein
MIDRKTEYKKVNSNKDSLEDTIKLLADITRKDIEKSYNITNSTNMEAYYSNRYGWTLRRIIT